MKAPSRRRRGVLTAIILLVAAAAFWAVIGHEPPATPFGPTSTAPDGAKGLALLLAQLGASVDTSGALPGPGKGVALVLDDQLDPSARARLTGWVRRGGALVVADPSSPLEGASVAQGLPDQPVTVVGPLVPACPAPWAKGVSRLAAVGDPMLEVPRGAVACFPGGPGDGDAFAVARGLGSGVVVALGGPDIWSNANLGDQDNALLAADLLAPAPGGSVAWLTSVPVGGGAQGIWSLVPARVKLCLLGLGLAVVAACGWRGRRLGRPVAEPLVVPLPASDLVVATGRLLARNRQSEQAAALARDELCEQLRGRFGQDAGTGPATVARVAALRTGMSSDEVVNALSGPPPRDEEELLGLLRSLQRIREEVLSGTSTAV